MDDWIQLTEEDLERARRMAEAAEEGPAMLVIRPDDVTEEEPPLILGDPITITSNDLVAAPPQPAAAGRLAELEQLMFQLVNQARRDHLPGWWRTVTLQWRDDLAAVARGHAADMLQRQYVAHVNPEGVTAAQRLQRYAIRYLACGENIGVVYGESSHSEQAVYDIQQAFLEQPRSLTNHRANLLNPIWTHVGIGIAYNPDGALVATQNFISAPMT